MVPLVIGRILWREFGGWRRVRENPLAGDVAAEVGATRMLSCTYGRKADRTEAELFLCVVPIAAGRREPAALTQGVPAGSGLGSGCNGDTAAGDAGTIEINRYIVSQARQRAVVLYWYQTPRRVVAGEWAAKLWLIPDALRDRRTDTALVRIVTFPGGGEDQPAVAAAEDFARDLYPRLRQLLRQNRSASKARIPISISGSAAGVGVRGGTGVAVRVGV